MFALKSANAVKAVFLAVAPAMLISATQGPVPETNNKAQAPSTPKVAMPALQSDPASDSALSQDFTLGKNRRMTVPVRINGSEPFAFVVDTGAERTVIADILGEQLSLTAGPQLKISTVSGLENVGSFQVEELTMSSLKVMDIEAPALKRRNIGAYGLLGIDSLEDRKIRIDFANNVMDILPSKKRRRYKKTDPNVIVVTARRKAGRLLLTDAKIGGMKADVIVDTGAELSIGNSALRKRLRRRQLYQDYIPVGLFSVTGERMSGDFTQIKKITLGGVNLANLPITFTEQHAFEMLELTRRPAIILGMDALRLFDGVEIDFANKRVAFQFARSSKRDVPSRWASVR